MFTSVTRVAAAVAVATGLALATTTSGAAATAPAGGVNDWSCQPGSAHPEPVVLLHGLGANGPENFAIDAPALAADGYCVFELTYGTTTLGPLVGGLGPMADSATKQVAPFVDRVLAATGAAKVDIVGHSEGSTVGAYYLKLAGGASKVDHFVGFGANYHGTTLDGLATLAAQTGLIKLTPILGVAAAQEFVPGSAFLATLDTGGIAVAGPTYTNIMSRYDDVVTPTPVA